MAGGRRLIVASFILLVFVILSYLSSRLYLDTDLFDLDSATAVFNDWRNPGSRAIKLEGPLASSIYDMFEQRFSNVIPQDYALHEIERACSLSKYKPNVYLQCDIMGAGMTTMFASVKTCLHLAFWLGTNLVIPTTPLRSQENLGEWEQIHMPLGQWIDRDFMMQRIKSSCPKLKFALLNEKKQPSIDVAASVNLNPCEGGIDPICSPYGPYGADDATNPWKDRFEGYFSRIAAEHPVEAGNVIVNMISTGMMHNKTGDPYVERGFYELVHLLRTVPKIRMIIAQITDHMSSSPGHMRPYFGVHFRAEGDAVAEVDHGWSSPQEQLDNVLEYVQRAQGILAPEETTNLIYLACGDQDKIDMFRNSASILGYDVIDKWSIAKSISTKLVDTIDKLDFDHMAAIDFALLLVSNFFIGTGHSAFSYNIAHDRSPTGRFLGNMLDLDDSVLLNNPSIALTRTQLFHPAAIDGSYQSCL